MAVRPLNVIRNIANSHLVRSLSLTNNLPPRDDIHEESRIVEETGRRCTDDERAPNERMADSFESTEAKGEGGEILVARGLSS